MLKLSKSFMHNDWREDVDRLLESNANSQQNPIPGAGILDGDALWDGQSNVNPDIKSQVPAIPDGYMYKEQTQDDVTVKVYADRMTGEVVARETIVRNPDGSSDVTTQFFDGDANTTNEDRATRVTYSTVDENGNIVTYRGKNQFPGFSSTPPNGSRPHKDSIGRATGYEDESFGGGSGVYEDESSGGGSGVNHDESHGSGSGVYHDESHGGGSGVNEDEGYGWGSNGGGVSVTRNEDGSVTYVESYEDGTSVTTVTTPDGNTHTTYREYSHITEEEVISHYPDGSTNTDNTYYDEYGNFTGSTHTHSEDNRTEITEYDAEGNVISESVTTRSVEVDTNGNRRIVTRREITDETTKSNTVSTYDPINRERTVVTTTSSNENGETKTTVTTTDARGNSNRSVTVDSPDGSSVTRTTTVDRKTKARTTTEEKTDAEGNVTVTSNVRKGSASSVEETKYDAEGNVTNQVRATEVVNEDGSRTRKIYLDDKTVIENIDPNGKVVGTPEERTSLREYATTHPNSNDGTLASNLSYVSSSMENIKNQIGAHEDVNHSKSSNREASVVGAMYDAANYYGATTNKLYSSLSSEADAIYGIGNLIFQMDQSQALLAEDRLTSNVAGLYSPSNPEMGLELERMKAATDSLRLTMSQEALSAGGRYDALMDTLGINLTPGKAGKLSVSDIKQAISAITPTLDSEIDRAKSLASGVSDFISGMGGMLQGGVWDNVKSNLSSYQDLLEVSAEAAQFLKDTLETAMGMIVDYMGDYEELDDTDLEEKKQALLELRNALEAAKDAYQAALSCVPRMPEYDTEGHMTAPGVVCPDISSLKAALDAAQVAFDEMQELVTKLEGLAEVLEAVEELIADAIAQIRAAYADPTGFIQSNQGFECHVDLSQYGIDPDKDYKQIFNDFINSISENQTGGPGEGGGYPPNNPDLYPGFGRKPERPTFGDPGFEKKPERPTFGDPGFERKPERPTFGDPGFDRTPRPQMPSTEVGDEDYDDGGANPPYNPQRPEVDTLPYRPGENNIEFDTLPYRPGEHNIEFDTLPYRPGEHNIEFDTLPYRPGEHNIEFDTLPNRPGEHDIEFDTLPYRPGEHNIEFDTLPYRPDQDRSEPVPLVK